MLIHADPRAYGRKSEAPSDLLVKASHFELSIKEDGPEGAISGYGSMWDKVDSYGEVVIEGAFKRSLAAWRKAKRPIPMLWQHRADSPVGVWDEFEEDAKGLKLAGRLNLETQRGREAWADVKMRAVGGLSIGYYEVKADPYDFGSTEPRKLIELDLRETSIVTFPALKEAQIDAVKARLARGEKLTLREFEAALREKFRLSRSDAEEIAALGYKAWIQRDAGQAADEVEGLKGLSEHLAAFELPTF